MRDLGWILREKRVRGWHKTTLCHPYFFRLSAHALAGGRTTLGEARIIPWLTKLRIDPSEIDRE